MSSTAGRPSVAYLTGEYPRSSDTFIQREVTGLRNAGFRVETFAVRRPDQAHLVGPEQERAHATTTYLLELARSPRLGSAKLAVILRRPGSFLKALGLAWRTKRPGVRGAAYQLIYFIEAVLLADEMRRRRLTHLHNHFGDSSCTVAMLASEISGVPYSFTLHGPGIFFEARSWQLGEKLDRASFTACISHFARSQAAIFASPETIDRLHIVHCGVEPERLKPVDHSGSATRLLFVGRVVELKGLGVLLDAISRLAERHPRLGLTVVGDGPDRDRLQRHAHSLGISDRVTFVGSRSQAEVADHLSGSDIFVLPSFAEGVPVVLMEALGAGLPVVASVVGGVVELVAEDINGFLVSPANVEQLADRLEQLIGDAELRQRFGTAGRATVVDQFDSRREAERLGSLFVNTAHGLPSLIRPEVPQPSGTLPT